MLERIKRFGDSVKSGKKAKIPVKFSALGTPYIDSGVSAISPQQLDRLVEKAMRERDERKYGVKLLK